MPESAAALIAEGQTELSAENSERAVALFERALELDPSVADAYLALFRVYRPEGSLAKELELWKRRVELQPGDASATERLGWVLWFTGRPDEALPWLHKAAEQNPTGRWPQFYLGNAQLALGSFAEAERCYRRALEITADHSSAHAGVIWSLLAAGRDEDARAHLRVFQASELDGDRLPVKFADIEYALGEDESALDHARAAIAEEPQERYWPRGFLPSTILGALGVGEQLASSEAIDRARLDGGDEGFMPHVDLAAVAAIRGDTRAACNSLRAAIAAGWRYGPLALRDRLFEYVRADDEFLSLVG